MAKQDLNGAQIRPPFEQVGRETVAKQMGRDVLVPKLGGACRVP